MGGDSGPIPAAARSSLLLVENLSAPSDTRVWSECLALKGAGFEVVVVCPEGAGDESVQHERRDGITIHRFPLKPARGGLFGYVLEYLSAFWRIRRLVRALARQRSFDVVHAANPPDFLLPAVRFLKRRGTRFIFDQHDLVPELYVTRFGTRRRLLYRLTLRFERLSFALADVVISPNNSYRQVALRRGAKSAEDVFVVRNGPDPDVFRPGEADETLKRGRAHLLAYVGTMNEQDGVDYAIRALAILKRSREDWRAIFVGDGDAAAGARRLADTLGLADFVDFTGRLPRPDVVRILATADVCLSPEPHNSLNDVSTFIKIGEYLSMARPVVAYDLPESRVTADGAAVYAEANDVEAFARGIDELLHDPDRRRAMGEIGRARVLSELSWECSRPQLLAAYARVLSSRH